jgi:thiol-disulfide isomerase/thioredoxin
LGTSLALAGCGMFDKKPKAESPPPMAKGTSGAPAMSTRGNSTQIADRTGLPPNVGGVLAGQVLDSYNRRVPPTLIQVVSLGEGQTNPAAPIEVAADNQGYFTIQGLQPGKTYQLIARAKDGDRVLVGKVSARPPKPNLLITMNDDPTGEAGKARAEAPSNSTPTASFPSGSGDSPKGVEIGAPVRTNGSASDSSPLNVTNPENIAREPVVKNDALIDIANPRFGSSEGSRRDIRELTSPAAVPVPSCVLTGKVLDNLALNDLNGQPWEFKKDHKGKLILIDFWGTWCGHCYPAIRHLMALNNTYQRYGLEVVGIAEEYPDGEGRDPSIKVAGACKRLGVNYRVLMGSGFTPSQDGAFKSTCPVKTQFGVNAFPTLVLLDDTGHILWRSEGLDDRRSAELQILIEKQLKIRR